MAVPAKAPVGQRLVTAFIALFCVSAVIALLGSALIARWYGVALAIVALCGAYVFAHVTVRGRLPGRFPAGGNAFIGDRQNVTANGTYRSAPIWQRAICAALAVGGGITIVAGVVTGHGLRSYQSAASLAFVLGGVYLFGYIALRGRLPEPYLGGGNAALHHRNWHSGG